METKTIFMVELNGTVHVVQIVRVPVTIVVVKGLPRDREDEIERLLDEAESILGRVDEIRREGGRVRGS